MSVLWDLSSGKQPHSYGTSPFLMGQLTISMAISVKSMIGYELTMGYDLFTGDISYHLVI